MNAMRKLPFDHVRAKLLQGISRGPCPDLKSGLGRPDVRMPVLEVGSWSEFGLKMSVRMLAMRKLPFDHVRAKLLQGVGRGPCPDLNSGLGRPDLRMSVLEVGFWSEFEGGYLVDKIS
jgi:hypothetical protein